MINNDNITVTDIQSVIYVKKNNPVGKIDFYTRKNGLGTHELIFRLCGEVETNFDGNVLNNKKSTVQFLPKGQGENEYSVETVDPGECIDIFFNTNIPLSDTAFCIDVNLPAEMKKMFEKINDIWIKKDVGYYCKSMSVLYKILTMLIETVNPLSKISDYPKIKTAVNYLNTNFCDYEIDFEYVASLSNISYSHFRHLFVKCMGISPAKYVTNKKTEYAKDLLESELYTVGEIAHIVGFKDVYYFSHAFKNITGFSPSIYKSKKQGQTV